MNAENITTTQKSPNGTLSGEKYKAWLSDFKELFKGIVLIANVLPVFAGFWVALAFNHAHFADYWGTFVLTLVGSTLIMAGALLINNWFDVDIDTVMHRTQKRPTVTGHISLKAVLIMGISLTALGQILLLFTTLEAAIYAFIGWFTYVFLYTMWSKRRYTLNTVIGSVSGAVTPLMGWAAIAPANHIIPIAMFLILFIWQVPHTFATAIKKYDEYKAAGVPMLPVVYGFAFTKRQMVVYIACLLPLPFLMLSLGTVFVVVGSLLNVVWLILGIWGFFMKDTVKWARVHFIYSLNYLTIIFFLMIVVTLPVFQ